MRMRKKKNLIPRMERCLPLLIDTDGTSPAVLPDAASGKKLFLEIGCGKGRFINETAKADPDCFCVALERDANALVMAMERTMDDNPGNLAYINCDAALLPNIFGKGGVSRIFVNFCDPWPRSRHSKRRLTSRSFLETYYELLAPGGELWFKTDNTNLFEFSLNEISAFRGFEMRNISLDLHASGIPNIMTEYEEKFSSQGMKIYRLEALKLNQTSPNDLSADSMKNIVTSENSVVDTTT